ncbi:MAG: DNA polymerase III subunit gamma/tau [Burkholderiaceae bacterium]
MSHQVLARKWRPRSFDTLVGQDHVVRALSHALTSGRLHHAYLFTGTRGVGKTTIARILAKAVNCETGLTPAPCGACPACEQIDSGRFVDYVELDAASNRGVDEMAQLLDNAVYAPTMGRYKVFVIDEVHMLSTHAFNAMLKTLEEPPPHLLFILATTDPQKVPVTVLSRCMQFNLRNMRPATIAGHLASVLEAEQVPADAPALELIGRSAAGSMRDALSLTDQAIGFGAGEVREAQVREMLGVLDGRFVEQLLDALADRDGAALVAISQQVAEQNVSAQRLLADLAERFSALAVLEALGPGAGEQGDGHLAAAAPWQGRFAATDLQVHYQAAIYGQRDLPLAPDMATGLLMALLRMRAFSIDEPDADPAPAVAPAGDRPRAGQPATTAKAAADAAPAPPSRASGQSGDNLARPRRAARPPPMRRRGPDRHRPAPPNARRWRHCARSVSGPAAAAKAARRLPPARYPMPTKSLTGRRAVPRRPALAGCHHWTDRPGDVR